MTNEDPEETIALLRVEVAALKEYAATLSLELLTYAPAVWVNVFKNERTTLYKKKSCKGSGDTAPAQERN